MKTRGLLGLWSWLTLDQAAKIFATDGFPVKNGADVSFPDTPLQLLGNRQEFHENMIQGCVDYYGEKGDQCLRNDQDRIAMSLQQPQSMQNYTSMGFAKMRTPDSLWISIRKFWQRNQGKYKDEQWSAGNTYMNHWSSPTYLLSVEDSRLRGGGVELKKQLWGAAKEAIQDWTGEHLTEVRLFGIRVYTEGSVLNSHVDSLPHVFSAIINVDQDLDEPWPLEVIGHDGRAHNITLEPGDMVLYESHSVLHARPFPLKGRHVSNIYIHFEPKDHTRRHGLEVHNGKDVDTKYMEATGNGHAGHESTLDGLPSYLIEGSPDEKNFLKYFPPEPLPTFGTGGTPSHIAAQHGDVNTLRQLTEEGSAPVDLPDDNGWTPMHEGAKGGHLEVVEFLHQQGADPNRRANGGAGGTALYYAAEYHGMDHPVSRFLSSIGAIHAPPEL